LRADADDNAMFCYLQKEKVKKEEDKRRRRKETEAKVTVGCRASIGTDASEKEL